MSEIVYAELNTNNLCIGLLTSPKPIEKENYVEIEASDNDLFWRKYDTQTGTWSQEKFLPDRAAIQLDEFEQLKADKEALESELQNIKMFNAMNLKDISNARNETKSVKALTSDLLLKMARNGIN